MKKRGVIILAVSFLFWFVMSACGSKVNQDNFNKIQVGMTFEEVTGILGPSTESSSVQIGGLSGTSAKWASKEGAIQIQFLNGKVRIKQFSKP
jgi:hypothetical protein